MEPKAVLDEPRVRQMAQEIFTKLHGLGVRTGDVTYQGVTFQVYVWDVEKGLVSGLVEQEVDGVTDWIAYEVRLGA